MLMSLVKTSLKPVISEFKSQLRRAVERGGVPGVTTPGPGPKRGPDTNCYKFTSTPRYEVKLIAD